MRTKHVDGKVRALGEVPLFRGLDTAQLETLARYVDEVSVPEGRVLASQGARGQELIVLLDGSARVERDGTVIANLTAGDVVGEMAVIDGKERTADVIAEEACRVLVMHAKDFSDAVESAPALARRIMETLVGRLRAMDERLSV